MKHIKWQSLTCNFALRRRSSGLSESQIFQAGPFCGSDLFVPKPFAMLQNIVLLLILTGPLIHPSVNNSVFMSSPFVLQVGMDSCAHHSFTVQDIRCVPRHGWLLCMSWSESFLQNRTIEIAEWIVWSTDEHWGDHCKEPFFYLNQSILVVIQGVEHYLTKSRKQQIRLIS